MASVLATVLYFALLICTWGFISLVTDSDVVEARFGPLIGPTMVAIATVIVCGGCLARIRNPSGWLLPVVIAAGVFLAPAIIGAAIVTVTRVDLAAGLLFFAARITSPYVPAAAIIAALMVIFIPLARSRPTA